MRKTHFFVAAMLVLLISSVVSAVSINSESSQQFTPGMQGSISISIDNNFDEDIEDVSLSLQLANTEFIAIGSSQYSADEIQDGRDKTARFTLRPAYDITPGDYSIPYILTYSIDGETQTPKQGTIGVSVTANPELRFAASQETPIIGQKGSITLRIVNDGLADARFVSVRLIPSGFTLLSDDEVYIGTIDSDDFESTSFDVIFREENSVVNALVQYRDLSNVEKTQTVAIPFSAYSQKQAIEMGLIQQSYASFYAIVIVLVLVIWFIWRSIRKRRRNKARSEQ